MPGGLAHRILGRHSLAHAVVQIRVRLQIGKSLMAASDDPLFLGLRGPSGREFRLDLQKGRSRRRGHDDVYVLGSPEDPDTNIRHPEFNDPTAPVLDVDSIFSLYLRKGFEPIPNARGRRSCPHANRRRGSGVAPGGLPARRARLSSRGRSPIRGHPRWQPARRSG